MLLANLLRKPEKSTCSQTGALQEKGCKKRLSKRSLERGNLQRLIFGNFASRKPANIDLLTSRSPAREGLQDEASQAKPRKRPSSMIEFWPFCLEKTIKNRPTHKQAFAPDRQRLERLRPQGPLCDDFRGPRPHPPDNPSFHSPQGRGPAGP